MTFRGTLVLALLAGVLLLRAVELRIPEITRPFWEDEIHHNEPILASPTLTALSEHNMMIAQSQPLLDFVVRKFFWFPIHGHQEYALRLPSLVYGALAGPLAFFLAFGIFRRRDSSFAEATALAFLVGLWAVDHPQLIYDSGEARHYSLVAALSLAWCLLFFLRDATPRLPFVVITLLFANVHFFALVLVATGYAWWIQQGLRQRRFFDVALAAGTLGAVIATLWFFERPQLEMLLSNPPNRTVSGEVPFLAGLHAALGGGFDLWLDFQTYLAFPLPWWLWWAVLCAGALLLRARFLAPLVAAGLLLMPAFLAYCRMRSSYTFAPRYFSPFFGIGAAAVAAALLLGARGYTRIVASRPAWRRPILATGAVALAVMFSVPAFALRIGPDVSKLHRPPQNFSPYYRVYEEIKRSDLPVFVLHNHCYANDIPRMYFDHIGEHPYRRYRVADAMGCEGSTRRVRYRIEEFLRTSPPTALVVLDQKEQDCGQRTSAPVEGMRIERVKSTTECVWIIQGARSFDDVRVAAERTGFRSAPGVF